jgi:hypothetical protein
MTDPVPQQFPAAPDHGFNRIDRRKLRADRDVAHRGFFHRILISWAGRNLRAPRPGDTTVIVIVALMIARRRSMAALARGG